MFGNAFLASWNDVDPLLEAEYQRWHRVEHMPERLAVHVNKIVCVPFIP